MWSRADRLGFFLLVFLHSIHTKMTVEPIPAFSEPVSPADWFTPLVRGLLRLRSRVR